MAGYIDNSSDLALFESYSEGRALAGARLENLSKFAQWSAVGDAKTCDWCAWADMRVFDRTVEPYDPPTHHGCRCLVAYITNDEFPPDPDWGSGPPSQAWPPGSYSKDVESKLDDVLKDIAPDKPILADPAEVATAWKNKMGDVPTKELQMKANKLVDEAPKTDKTLYRGIGTEEADRVGLKLKSDGTPQVGSTFETRAVSWSDDRTVALDFAEGQGGVILRLAGKPTQHRSFHLQKAYEPKFGDVFPEAFVQESEWLSGGVLEVIGSQTIEGKTVVNVVQRATPGA